jgi:hypothetical protein
MKRKLFHVVTVISVILWVVIGVFWLQSMFGSDYFKYWASTHLSRYEETPVIEGGTYANEIWFVFREFPSGPVMSTAYPGFYWSHHDFQFEPTSWQGWWGGYECCGFGLCVKSNLAYLQNLTQDLPDPPAWNYGMKIPFWFPMTCCSILPGLWFWRWRAGRSQIPRCKACGYDLRGAGDSCPECGAIPAQSSKTQ